MRLLQKTLTLLIVVVIFVIPVLILSSTATATSINLVNSKSWVDVYSVMLYGALNGERSFFVNSESITSLTRVIPSTVDVKLYESENPFIKNIDNQLATGGYNVIKQKEGKNLNLELDPQTGRYILVGEGNYRIALSLAPYAVQEKAWVLFVNDDNLDEVVKRISHADFVLGVGNFKRDILKSIEPHFTDRINNNNIFKDSQEIATRFPSLKNVVIADGSMLEAEFFNTKNPVLLSGLNKILDDTYNFLEEHNVKNVIIVGNRLAVVGEQIRSRSNKKIAVFVKFGQSDAANNGKIYALTMFPTPVPVPKLIVTKAIYNPSSQEVIAYFTNEGNIELYAISTITVKNKDKELGSASDKEAHFIGVGETLPVRYKIPIPVDEITKDTVVEFYTSYGLMPSQLDTFLTMKNKYGPPFSTPLIVQEIADDDSQLTLMDAAYYKYAKRVGVTLNNPSTHKVYFAIKIKNLIVNGLEKDFFKKGLLQAGQTKTFYIPVQLDDIDLEENEEFDLSILYGKDADFLLKTIKQNLPFKVKGGSLISGMVASFTGEASPVTAIIIVLVLGGIIGLVIYKLKNKE